MLKNLKNGLVKPSLLHCANNFSSQIYWSGKKGRGENSVCELVGNSSEAAQIILKYFSTSLDTNLHGPEDLM